MHGENSKLVLIGVVRYTPSALLHHS